MAESDQVDFPEPPIHPGQVDRTLGGYFANPESPRPDEVRQLLDGLLLRNAELESKVGNLKKIVRQLEAYRDRYVDLYELAPVGYATLDEDGYVQEINLAGAQLLGRDRDELIGQPFENRVKAEDRKSLGEKIRRCCSERQAMTFEVGLIAKDGQVIAAQVRGIAIESLKNEGTFCKIAITDITERSRVEEAIKASEANYRAIFDTANDAIFVHDADTGAILDTNQKTTEMFGYTPEELRELNVESISEGTPPYSQQEALHWLRQASAGVPQLFVWKCRDKTGRLFWVEVNIKRTILNGVPRLLAIVRDITDRKPAVEIRRDNP
jgi:PAS domain S-box-containing protein